jgi:hypothetical protein
LVADGIEHEEPKTSSHWLTEWLRGREIDPHGLVHERYDGVGKEIGPGVRIEPSPLLRDQVFPAAVEYSQMMTGNPDFHLRHLTFALLNEVAGRDLDPPFTKEMLAELRRDYIDRVVELYPSEREHWEKISRSRRREYVATHADAPAIVDTLGRQTFANVLRERIEQVYENLESGPRDDAAFILHVDGPWGSGKSSILNFLRKDLLKSDPPWIVVDFNAWRNQARKPAWWPLISEVGSSIRRIDWYEVPEARTIWSLWNLRMRWMPLALAASAVVLAILYFSGLDFDLEQVGKRLDTAMKGLLALVTLGGFAWTATRTVALGSKSAAEAYLQSSTDPYRPIIKMFDQLVRTTRKPVAVFIDDIDRCDSSYVIELLEGIQTLLRTAPVVYIVAGDRKWITSSFQKRYADFCDNIGVPGRPLGYLFLDKVFRLSTPIPRLSGTRQSGFWKQLLGINDPKLIKESVAHLEAEAGALLKGAREHEEVQALIDKTKEGSLEREAIRGKAALHVTSREATEAAEHRLEPLADLLERNPRSMKRLVNAYGLNRSIAYLEERRVPVETLARWTIIELRWPILADYLSVNWTDIANGSLRPGDFPDHIRALLNDTDVQQVVGDADAEGRLTKDTLASILG